MRPEHLLLVFLLSTMLAPAEVASQQPQTRGRAGLSSISGHKDPLLRPSLGQYLAGWQRVFTTKANLFYLAAWGSSFLIIRPFDDDISQELGQENDSFADLVSGFGHPIVLAGGATLTYLVGSVTKNPEVSTTGLLLLESYLTTSVVTVSLKTAVGRERPNHKNHRSFPSGHTSGAFSVASVLDKRYGVRVGIPAYLTASLVGLSRVRLKEHFPTDVLAGAALGVIIGRSFAADGKRDSLSVFPMLHRGYIGVALGARF